MATALSFSITAEDQTAKAMESVNKRIADFQARTQRSMSGVEKRMEAVHARFAAMGARMGAFASGAAKVAGGFRDIARAGTDAYQRVGQLVPVLGALTSVATVAGIGRMSTAWADWGQQISNASQRIGIAGSRLSAFQGAAALAGSSGDAMTSGLQGMGQALYDAQGGRNTQAMVMARTLNLSAAEMRDSQSALFAVADRIQHMRNPFAQAQLLQAFNIPEELLPAMRKGADGLREYMAVAQRLNPVTDEMTARAGRFHEAQNRVTQAVEGLRNKIADRLAPVLTPLLMRFSEWIASSPVVAQGVEWLGRQVEQLGQWLETGGLQRFGETLSGWLQPLGAVAHALGGDGGVRGAVEALALVMGGSFVLKIVTPWLMLASAIAGATARLSGFTAAQAAGVGGGGMLGKLGGLASGLGLAGLAWEGLNWLEPKTEPQSNGVGNLLHNFLFDMNPGHWTRSYHPGQDASRAGNPPGPSVGTPSADHAAFYKQWGPAAARAGAALGDDPNVVLAHWAQETSFGRNVHDFNIGNMQAGSSWQGRTVVRGDTHKDGSAYQTRFRAYDSPEQFADDYVDRIKKRWPGAMNVGGDALAFGRGMRPGQQGGYMENPNAAEDIARTASKVRREMTLQTPTAQGAPLALEHDRIALSRRGIPARPEI